jgi:hypothetical protein
MNGKAPQARSARLVKVAVWVVAIIAALTLFGFFGLPPLLKWQIEGRLTEALQRRVTIERIELNPFTLEATVSGFNLRERGVDRPALTFSSLYTRFSPRSVIELAPVIEVLTLTRPQLRIARAQDGRYSLEDLWASPTPPPPPSEPLRFALANLRLLDGSVEFDDRKGGQRHVFRAIALDLPLLSNLDEHLDVFVRPRLNLVVNGAPLSIEARSKPFRDARSTQLKLALKDVDLPHYLAYLPTSLPFTIPAAKLGATLGIELAIGTDGKPRLRVQGEALAQGIVLNQRDGAEVLRLTSLKVEKFDLDLSARQVTVGALRLESPALKLAREVDGSLSLARLAPSDDVAAQPPAQAAPPWKLTLAEFALSGGSVQFEDRTLTPTLKTAARQIGFTAQGFASTPDNPNRVQLDATLDSGGTLAVSGTLGNDLQGQLEVEISDVDLPPFWPHAQPHIAARLRQGALSAKGRLELGRAAGTPTVSYRGELTLHDVDVQAEHRKADLIKWKSLHLAGVEADSAPARLHITEARLSDFYKRLILDENGKLNLLLLGRHGATAVDTKPVQGAQAITQAPTQSGAMPDWIEIRKLTLQRGTMNFSDHFIKPNYSAHITSLNGSIGPLKRGQQGTIQLRGKVASTAPLSIEGRLDTFSEALFLDINANASDIELAPLSSYSGKYLGYGIDKGKLSAQIHYKLEQRALTAENHITLDQLSFGAPIESKDATKLPLLFAVSLLKDGNGMIDVDMPVSGSLDDPEFSVSGIVLKLIFNLITKAITAPFALLGSLIPGGGEELGYVEFAAGSAALDDPAREKLDKLAQVLKQRPGLKLDIGGRSAPAEDDAGLRQRWLDDELRRRQFARLKRKGQAPAEPDAVEISPADYPDLLEDVYEDADFDRPRNAIGLVKDQPVEVMERMLREHATVGAGALDELAGQRAQATKLYLQEAGGIPAERLYLVASKESAKAVGDQGQPMRVEFALK